MKDAIMLNDDVFNSPVGAGKVTGLTDSGYPQVNHVAVARLAIKIKEDHFLIYDANGSYSRGEWEMFLDDERVPADSQSSSVVVVRSSQEAIAFCMAVDSLPKRIMFDHDLGGDDTSIKFILWMIEQLYADHPKFTLREDFTFSVHSQNPVGAGNITSLMNNLIKDYRGEKQMNFIAFRFTDNDFHEPLRKAIEYVQANKSGELTLKAYKEYVIRGMIAFDSLRDIRMWSFENRTSVDRREYFDKTLSVAPLIKLDKLTPGFEGFILDMRTNQVSLRTL